MKREEFNGKDNTFEVHEQFEKMRWNFWAVLLLDLEVDEVSKRTTK